MYGKKNFNNIPEDVQQNPRRNDAYVNGKSYNFYQWDKAGDAAKIARLCPAGWAESHPGAPCEEILNRYRRGNCNSDGCRGNNHSFTFLPPAPVPLIEPVGLRAEAPLHVMVSAGFTGGDRYIDIRQLCRYTRLFWFLWTSRRSSSASALD